MHRAAGIVFVLLLLAPNARAEPSPEEVVGDGVQGILISQTQPRACPALSTGTAGTSEDASRYDGDVDRGNGLSPGDATSAPASLPDRIHLRSTTATFNRRYWFVLDGGRIYFKSNAEVTGIEQPWAPLPGNSCFDGDVQGISVDDDELLAIDSERQIYTMDGALLDPSSFNWTVRWGPLFWTGPGRTLPDGRAWSWSVSSPLEDGTFTDPAGNVHPVGGAKVSHVWLLNQSGQRLTYMDPWLPADESYEMCGPRRGRFRSVAMSASGSMVFVMNRFGDMFTRLYDFDISGPDSFFLSYSYEDQRGVADPAIQLPPEPWTRQPKIPGRITSAISIEKVGTGSIHRTLRVEGKRHGRVGYWEKDVVKPRSRAWRFHPTGGKRAGRPLRNPRVNTVGRRLGPSEDATYAGGGEGVRAVIANFNVYCSPARLKVRLSGGKRIGLILHSTDAIRQSPRARGLDDEPRLVQGTIEAPDAVLASRNPEVEAFVSRYLSGRFTEARIDATTSRLEFPQQGWSFTPAKP